MGTNCENYAGYQTKTRDGDVCKHCDIQSPHEGGYDTNPENYCRNPDGESSIWSYTTNPDERWAYCDPMTEEEQYC